jgi:hypothetical protein
MEKFRQPTTLLARRAEMGQHHRISGKYLYQYANEMAWRRQPPRLEWDQLQILTEREWQPWS